MTLTITRPGPVPLESPVADLAPVIANRARALAVVLSSVATSGTGVARAAALLGDAFVNGGTALVCGNGGSAAEAQHLVGELVGRFRRDRAPLPALALTADSAVLTAIANDYDFQTVFERQVAAFGRPGDIFIGFSTSGESANVVNGAHRARERGLTVIAFTGREPTRLGRLADVQVAVPSRETPLIQEAHTVLVHVICDAVESRLFGCREQEVGVR